MKVQSKVKVIFLASKWIQKGQTTFKDIKINKSSSPMVQAVNLPNILAYPTFKSDKLPSIYQKNLDTPKRIEYKNFVDNKICNKENGQIDM